MDRSDEPVGFDKPAVEAFGEYPTPPDDPDAPRPALAPGLKASLTRASKPKLSELDRATLAAAEGLSEQRARRPGITLPYVHFLARPYPPWWGEATPKPARRKGGAR
jgi:hypothetical protein